MTNPKAGLKELLTQKLHSLVSDLKADFSAIAFYDPLNMEFRWRLATGSLNNRYTNIVVNSGKGICGRALKTKREFIITNFPEELRDEALEFPILIIEELKSAASVPIIFQSQLIGVLLVGQRTCRNYEANDIERIKFAAEEILHDYMNERETEQTNPEEKQETKKSVLSRYFVEEKSKWGEKLEIILLDQRITMLSDEAQQSLITIFKLLFNLTLGTENNSKIKVTIELKSDQQFAIQIETSQYLSFSDEVFSHLADEVRKINGSIETIFDAERTILTMNFFLSLLFEDQLWNKATESRN